MRTIYPFKLSSTEKPLPRLRRDGIVQTWIKADVDNDTHPKILQMSWTRGIDEYATADLEMRWWRWARKAAPRALRAAHRDR